LLVSGPANSIDNVPLSDVLPRDYAPAADRLSQLAHQLETHPMAAERIHWHWYAENNTKLATPPERAYTLVFDATITLFEQSSDSLELALDVGWRPGLTVNTAVEVACWCTKYHNIHQLRDSRRPVADADELVEAFAAGIAMLTDVLDSGPFDPRPWRLDAGLPDAPPEVR
jgi:hypothetical protein